jgi:hypothetical protein
MKKGYLVLLAFTIIACTREIDFKESEVEKRLVVNSLICPDSLISVNVRKTTCILSSENSIVDNAEVILFKNRLAIDTLRYFDQGNYKSAKYHAYAGNTYSVTVKSPEYPDVYAIDTVPEATSIINGTRVSGDTFDEYGDPHIDYEIVINDSPEKNYYELFFIQQQFPHESRSSYSITFQVEPVIADPVLRAESDLDYYPFTYLFSDKLFNGQKYFMKNKFMSAATGGYFTASFAPEPEVHYVILRTVSRNYFNYRKLWLRHYRNQQIGNKVEEPISTTLLGSPIPMYSNVEGGYGIFAAYNQTYYKLKEQ